MQLKVKRLNHNILYADETKYYYSHQNKIYLKSIHKEKPELWHSFNVNFLLKFVLKFGALSRLFRIGFHHLIVNELGSLVIFNKDVYLINDGEVSNTGKLVGSRPIYVCFHAGTFFYGEYTSNIERNPIKLMALEIYSKRWSVVKKFEGIRHIHGVFFDSFSDRLWITTGDEDNECMIMSQSNDDFDFHEVVGGKQSFRAVALTFSKKYIYYGTDTPREKNYICRLCRKSKKLVKLQEVGGSVFYGSRLGQGFLFSTVVEPSKVNTSKYSEIWYSANGRKWEVIKRLKMSALPMRLFQYPQIKLIANISNNGIVACRPLSTTKDNESIILSLPEIKK